MTELLEFRTREERKRSKIFEEANQRLLMVTSGGNPAVHGGEETR